MSIQMVLKAETIDFEILIIMLEQMMKNLK